jgi:hypothetical protein
MSKIIPRNVFVLCFVMSSPLLSCFSVILRSLLVIMIDFVTQSFREFITKIVLITSLVFSLSFGVTFTPGSLLRTFKLGEF